MTSEEYGQYIDDFELGADVMPGESLTDYIERRRREFESKADGGSIGIEVLFTEKKPRKNFNQGGYEPLFTEDVETFTAPIGLNTVSVPSRINKEYTDATNEAFRIGNVANRTGLVNPESIMKVSEMPLAIRTLSDINRMDPSSNVITDKYKEQGLPSDYRHTLGTSAFKDSIIDYLGSNLGINKQSGILDTIGSLAAKGATVFEEGKDAISSLKEYYKDKEASKNPELFNLKLSEILAQPIEDFEANFFAADQIPFGTPPLKKMEMIQAYRKFGMDNYMQQLENQKKAAMQEQIKKAEIEAQKRKIATTPGRKTGSGGREVATGAGAVAGAQQDISNYQSFGEVPLADGGRVGLFMGGPALEGQALNIYNSMNAYGFSDQEIADALSARGLYTAPGSGTKQPEQVTGIIGTQLNQGGDDKPMIQPFRQDPRVGAAFEAYQRNQQLQSMGIEDPFADEISLQGAYYEDMPNVDLKPGSQTFMGKLKSGIGEVLNFPLVKGVSLMTPFGLAKQGLSALKNVLPVNQRAIAENVAGNMGIAVDDIGRIVNTGNYQDPDNVMAGYNLNKMTDETFDKRIDRTSKTLSEKYGLSDKQIQGILEGTLSEKELADINARAIMPGTNKTTNLIKQLRSINIAKDRNKFIQDVAKKEAERQKAEREAKKRQKAIADANKPYSGPTFYNTRDDGSRGSAISQDFQNTTASLDNYSADVLRAKGGMVGYKDGGLATMFTRRR
jgi:hypothetical protein